jgi:hypothetical protein
VVPPASQRSLPSPMVLRNIPDGFWISRTRLSRSLASYSKAFCYPKNHHLRESCNPPLFLRYEYIITTCYRNYKSYNTSPTLLPQKQRGLGFARFARRLLRASNYRFLFLILLRYFSSDGSPHAASQRTQKSNVKSQNHSSKLVNDQTHSVLRF